MKIIYRIVLSVVMAALLLASCQHNEHPIGLPSGEEVSVSISAVLPGDGGAVVKSNAVPGNGSEVNRCILEVYLIGDDNAASLYGKREIVEVTGLKASFDDLNLITGQKYRFVLWADHVEAPDTEDGLAADNFYDTDAEGIGLQNVTINDVKAYAGNDDQRDAFFYSSPEDVTVTGPADYTLDLKRPFGQLNIITTDYGLIPEDHNGLLPAKVQLTYKNIPTGINLLTGELLTTDTDGSVTTQEVAGTAVDIAGPAVEGNDDAKQLSFDYILAPATGQHVINELKMSFLKSDRSATGITDYTFKSLPVQRNYRTNVSGALLTDRAGLSIEVKPDFDETVTVAEQAETIEAAQLAINAGMTDIEFTKAVNGTITLPKGNKNYRIAFNEGTNGAITINGSDFTGNVEVENNGSSSNALAISLTNGSAEVKSGTWGNIEVKTGTGFVLGEKAEGKRLSTNRGKGDIEIYGKISTFLPDFMWSGTVTVFTVYEEEACKDAFASLISGDCEKIVLGSDITYQNSNILTISGDKALTVDLNGKTLILDGVRLYTDEGASLSFCDGTIECKNVAAGTYPLAVQENASMTLENVTILRPGGCAVGVSQTTNGGELNIRGCTIESLTYAVGTNASSPVSQNVEIVIENSTLTGYTPLFLNIPLKATVTGCKLKGSSQGMILRGGNATVRDCEIVLETSDAVNPLIYNQWGEGYEAHNASFDEHGWGEGNDVPNAALTIGNKSTGYQYPTVLKIENTSLAVTGPYAEHCYEVYVYANEETGMGVNITFDGATGFDEDVFYGNDGKNITVNGSALDLSNQVFEVTTLDELLASIQTLATSGGTLIITEGSDIQLAGDSFAEPLAINKPTVIRVNGTLTSKNPGFYLKNNSTLKIEGSGNVKFNSKIVFNYGMLTVTGGSYLTDDLDDGCVFGNVEETAVMILNDVTVNASRFAVAGRGRIEINGGVISSISCNWQGKLAYCVRAEGGGEMTIRDAEVNGIQGCIASIEGSHILLDNVRAAYAKNTEGRTDAWYALYPASLGVIEVLSGEYYSDRTPCCYASDDDIELNPIGRFIFKGGKYSSMPKVYNKSNETTSDAVAAPGYKFQQISDGSEYKYEVVPQQ